MSGLDFSSSIDNGFSKDLVKMATQYAKFEHDSNAKSARMQKQFNAQVNKMGTGFASNSKKMQAEIDRLNKKLRTTATQTESTASKMKVALAGVVGTAAMAAFLRKTIEVRGEFEKLQIAFEASLKSKEKADRLMADIVQMASTTPFSLLEIASGAKQLMAFGESAETVLTTLSNMGDIAAGTGSDIQGLNLAYGQVMTKGKLMSQEMYQFAERGVPIIAELTKVTGKETTEIAKMVETGKVGFKDVQQVMFNLTAEGGRFYNLTAEQAKSLAGQYSNLGDSIDNMFNDIGKANDGILSDGISGAKFLVEHWEDLANVLGTIVTAYGAYKAAVMATAAIQKGQDIIKAIRLMNRLKDSIGLANAAQKAFNVTAMANPYAILAAAIAGVVAGLALFIDYTDEATQVSEELEESIRTRFETETTALKELEQRNKVAYLDKEKVSSIIKELNENYKDYLPNLISESENQSGVSKAISKVNSAIEENIILEEKRAKIKERTQVLAKLIGEAKTPDITERIRRVRTETIEIDGSNIDVSPIMARAIKAERDLIASLYKDVAKMAEEKANKEKGVEKEKLTTIKTIEAEITALTKKREETTDISNQADLDKFKAQIEEKQRLLDSLNGKGGKDPLKALEIANQQRINELTDIYGREESLADEFHLIMLNNELDYLNDKRDLTVDGLEKLKIAEQIIQTQIAIDRADEALSINVLADKYKNYHQSRLDITEKYNADITRLRKAGKENEAQVAENELRIELDSIDNAFLEKSKKYQEYLEDTLPDIIIAGLEYLQGEEEKLKLEIEIEGDVEKLVVLNAQLAEVQKKIKGVKTESDKGNKSFSDTIRQLRSIASSVEEIGDVFASSGGQSAILINGITGAASSMINLATAVQAVKAKMTALESATVILAVISATLQVINAITDAQEKKAQLIDETKARELAANYAINAALIEQIKLYEKGNELFASDQWGTALNGLTAYNEALKNQEALLNEIRDNSRQKESTTLLQKRVQNSFAGLYVRGVDKVFGGSKSNFDNNDRGNDLENALAAIEVMQEERGKVGKLFGLDDKTDNLIDVYPQLIDAQGQLNEKQLEYAINDANISEADRQRLVNLKDNLAQMEAAYKQFGDYVASIFGSLGDDVTQAFLESYIEVGDGFSTMAESSISAMDRMTDSMSGMIESFAKDAIEFSLLQPIIDQLNTAAKSLGEQYSKGVIDSENLQSGIIGAIGTAYSQINDVAPIALEALAAADKLAAEQGFESAFNSRNESTTGVSEVSSNTTGALQISQSITEDTGSAIVGRAGAIMLSNERILNVNQSMYDLALRNVVTLNMIKDNTDYLPEIAQNTKRTVDKLSGI